MAKTVFPLDGPLADSGQFSGKVAFSNGVKVTGGDLLFVSGQLGRGADRTMVGKGDAYAQTKQVLENVGKVLAQAGATFADVVKVTVFIKNMADFRKIHDARLEFFSEDSLPASSMVEVSGFVDPDALIEIEAIAVIGG